ncbi:MAG TPA: glycosyltransferase family 2 protein, partial [Candidatus Pacearchaeota archaeon]|nr:glycosyltransferase family 2 protein [Candidatus Pacearchaeota archaeon]
RTIESALELDYPKDKYEIIIVNDGSTDNTYEIAKKYLSKNAPTVRVLTKKNGGKSSALNLGINNSTSDIILTMDADTFAQKDALKKMIGYFYDEKIMSVIPSIGIYQPRSIWQRIQHIEYYLGVFSKKSFASVNSITVTPGAFSAYRREFFVKYGGYNEKTLSEDLEIALRIQSHDYLIESAPDAVVYTVAPNTFKELVVQRRRWYSGLVKNLWAYRKLFGPSNGVLGTITLPFQVISIIFGVSLTILLTIRGIIKVKTILLSLNAINFRFQDITEINQFVISHFFLTLISEPAFVFTALFSAAFLFYLYFSKKHIKFKESVKLNLLLFMTIYSFLFTFWWIISAIYVIFNKKITWREIENEVN